MGLINELYVGCVITDGDSVEKEVIINIDNRECDSSMSYDRVYSLYPYDKIFLLSGLVDEHKESQSEYIKIFKSANIRYKCREVPVTGTNPEISLNICNDVAPFGISKIECLEIRQLEKFIISEYR